MIRSRQRVQEHTNGADDARPAVVLLRLIVNVEIALPFQLGAVGEMVQSVAHVVCVGSLSVCFGSVLDLSTAVGCGEGWIWRWVQLLAQFHVSNSCNSGRTRKMSLDDLPCPVET